jgi:maleate isomerase
VKTLNRDVLGRRAKLGVLAPSTNTVVQPELDDMRPPGVTNHYSRIYTPNVAATSDERMMSGIAGIGAGVADALRSVMTCAPNHLLIGLSAISFMDGVHGADRYQAMIEREAGVPATLGSHACAAALKALNCGRRIAYFSPYWPAGNAHVTRFFQDAGFTVVRDLALRSRSWLEIAEIDAFQCRGFLQQIDGPDVDALLQVGTNLSMARLAGDAECWLGKPVIAVNTATYWHALRTIGIPDLIAGFGALLEKY